MRSLETPSEKFYSDRMLKKNCSRIPNHAPVLDSNLIELLVDFSDFLNTLRKTFLRSGIKI